MNDEAEEDDAEEEEDEEEDNDEDKDKDEDITHAISIADLHETNMETKINEGERELEGEREAPSK